MIALERSINFIHSDGEMYVAFQLIHFHVSKECEKNVLNLKLYNNARGIIFLIIIWMRS